MAEHLHPSVRRPVGDASQHPVPSPASTDAPFTGSHHTPFGASLEPALRRACQDRLSPITWFRTTWQRGGAATGYATWRDDHGQLHDVVVKLPVPPVELFWLQALQASTDVAPRLFAHGEGLDSYDLAWVVMERLPHGPLGAAWNGAEFDLTIEALGRFYAATQSVPLPPPASERDWMAVLDMARRHIADDHDVQHEQRWKNALKRMHKTLPELLAVWNRRARLDWCHGDLHLANAMARREAPHGPAVLLDFAQVHPGHWVEDAVYFEHLYWARRPRLGGRKLVSLIAAQRRRRGLYVDSDWPQLASIKRALLAMSTPAMLQADGDPHHVAACLEVLEMGVGR